MPATRTSYSVPVVLQEGLDKFVELSACSNITNMILTVAQHPEEAGAAMLPIMEKYSPKKEWRSVPNKVEKAAERLRGKFTAEELQALMDQLKNQQEYN